MQARPEEKNEKQETENRKQNMESNPDPKSSKSYAHGHRTTKVVLAEFASQEGGNVGNATE
jgi:hypothetical protein